MSQIAIFEHGVAGRLKFVHEILELYLIGKLCIKYLRGGEVAYFIDALNHWEFPSNSITFELLSYYIGQEMSQKDVENITFQCINKPRAFKNILQLLSIAHCDGSFLKNIAAKKDLSGIEFGI